MTTSRHAALEFHHITKPQRPPRYFQCMVSDRFSYYRVAKDRQLTTLAEAVRYGLCERPYAVPSMFFYDDVGSALFQDICMQPEYYQTRTETYILESIQEELSGLLSKHIRLADLGSGASAKTRRVLDALAGEGKSIQYVPIDVSDVIEDWSGSLIRDYTNLTVTGIVDTYEYGMAMLKDVSGPPTVMMFLGSSLGNMRPDESDMFLQKVRSTMRPQDVLLLGLDLVKDVHVLESAYNDSAGVTARFNKNILYRMNRDLEADFDVSRFSHYAPYNVKEGRIEMHLISDVDQTIHIPRADVTLSLRCGESIHTENSYKYTTTQIHQMAKRAGFSVRRLWCDRDRLFSVTLMEPA